MKAIGAFKVFPSKLLPQEIQRFPGKTHGKKY